MATKQITELDPTNSFDPGDLLLVRKSGEGVDKSITQQKFIETLGNPSVIGFIATSTVANEIVLTPTNDVAIDKYYDKMVVTFISPITSTGAVNVKIVGLTNKLMREIQTTNTSTLVAGKYYTAIYSISDGIFYQTNVVTPYIFTNEYIVTNTAITPGISTTYSLTSAIGASKPNYYLGMTAFFKVTTASQGAVFINIDGLGNKSLQDPEGDNIPFALLANERIFADYDNTVFRKHMFSNLEPIDPNPIDPPIVAPITVGSGGSYATIDAAILALCTQYGEDGQGTTATIQLLSNYVIPIVQITRSTPWITIKSAAAGNNMTGHFSIQSYCKINITGKFILSSSMLYFIFMSSLDSSSSVIVKNTIIERTPTIAETFKTVIMTIGKNGSANNPNSETITFENVTVSGFHAIYSVNYNDFQSLRTFTYNTGNVTLNNNAPSSEVTRPVIAGYSKIQLNNVNFNNCSREITDGLFQVYSSINMNEVTMTCNSDTSILKIKSVNNEQSILTNTSLRNTTTSTKPAVSSRSALLISGGDYRHPNSSSSPDIVAEDYVNAVIQLRNFNPASPYPQGSTAALGQGRIVPNQ